jgi:hypothetical protein
VTPPCEMNAKMVVPIGREQSERRGQSEAVAVMNIVGESKRDKAAWPKGLHRCGTPAEVHAQGHIEQLEKGLRGPW